MNLFLMFGSSLLALAIVIFMLIKKMDIKITLFLVGILLMIVSILMGNPVIEEPVNIVVDSVLSVVDQFKNTLNGAGFIILILGGYTAYMNEIGANDVTVSALTKPLKSIKSPYVLVPVVFLLGNLMSLVVPSASNLSIILLATLYPVLIKAGMSNLTAAAVIATTATVMPTPLGADNVAVASELGMPVADYVFKYHAVVSIPTLLIMAIAHTIWQKNRDKKIDFTKEIAHESAVKENQLFDGGTVFKSIYTILPLLPIIILLIVFAINSFAGTKINLSVEVVSIISFIVAIICELIRKKDGKEVLKTSDKFFAGMGGAMGIVVLLVAASTFVNGLKSIGLINYLQDTMLNTHASGIILPLILVVFTAIIVLLSGSGVALFYAMVPLMVPLADAAGISPFLVTVPMGLAGNLLRAVSPVSAVVMIVAGTTKQQPIEIVKRTAIPMISGVIFMFVFSMILFK